MSDTPDDNRWHLEKKVQLPVVALLLLQIVGLAVWAGTLSARIEDHERRTVRLEASTEVRIARDMQTEGRLARIEVGVQSLLDTVGRLERRIDDRREEGR